MTTTIDIASAGAVVNAVADRLATPTQLTHVALPQGWWPQSLAYGATGIALLHIERAGAGPVPWQPAHDWLAAAVSDGVDASDSASHLYYGAPALAFVLRIAAAHHPGRYARALATLDQHVTPLTRRRLERAHARIDAGQLPALAEFDTIRGLAGIGAHLRHSVEQHGLLRDVLTYLVRLTEPLSNHGDTLPGWWSDLDPGGNPNNPVYPGGHANLGMAHGIAGPLAMRAGITVDGHATAIRRICRWLDTWVQDGPAGPWWPYWLTRAELGSGRVQRPGPARPSWCYGTPGIARAQQLAALAVGDTARQQHAEAALVAAVTDPAQLATIVDRSLCHGYAGLLHIVNRAAADALTPHVAACLPALLAATLDTATNDTATALLQPPCGDPGLLEGAIGTALALHTHIQPATTRWDACLLTA